MLFIGFWHRLKQILDEIISPTQSAFISNRLITDNVIISYECLNKIGQSRRKKNGLVALKLDISKAYDRIKWSFVEKAMQQLGFFVNWVNLVMNYISTASLSVLINGVPKCLIYPQRGLRQGCPLSPYLFIICAEAFLNLFMVAEKQKLIHGLRFSRNLSVSHILFADDNLIFSRASNEDCKKLKIDLLCVFQRFGSDFQLQKILQDFQLQKILHDFQQHHKSETGGGD